MCGVNINHEKACKIIVLKARILKVFLWKRPIPQFGIRAKDNVQSPKSGRGGDSFLLPYGNRSMLVWEICLENPFSLSSENQIKLTKFMEDGRIALPLSLEMREYCTKSGIL